MNDQLFKAKELGLAVRVKIAEMDVSVGDDMSAVAEQVGVTLAQLHDLRGGVCSDVYAVASAIKWIERNPLEFFPYTVEPDGPIARQ
jgi:hypothetical protein